MANTAVIGGGPMGLACAYQLLLEGHQVDLYEADDRLGGMSAHFDFNGVDIERYYHFICKEDKALFKLLDELHLRDKLHWSDTRMGYYYQGQLYQWGNPIALLRFTGVNIISRLRYGLHMFISSKLRYWQHLENIDAVSWIKRWQGEHAYNKLWLKLFELKFHQYTANLSAAWIWARIRRVGRSRKSIMQEQMGYMQGGSNTIINALKNEIQRRGGNIHLNVTVKQLIHKNNHITGLETVTGVQHYDQIYCTIPLPFIPKIITGLPSEHLNLYRNIKNIGVVCLIFKLKRQLTNNFWLNINDDDIEIPGIIEYTNLYPKQHHIVYVPFYLPHNHEKYKYPDEKFIEESKHYLFRINPSLSDTDIIDINVSRYGFAQPICPPGFSASLPPIKSDIAGLYIADTSHYYPEDRSITESIALGRKMAKM